MKSYRKELMFHTKNRRQSINIIGEVAARLKESGIREGFLLCNAMHITASVFINDDESGLHQDKVREVEPNPVFCTREAPHAALSSLLYSK